MNLMVKDSIIRIGKRKSAEIDIKGKQLKIDTLCSTDEGVAFLLHFEGKCIYHAGDLNWWSWSGITAQENEAMADAYKEEINRLASETIDVAFVVLDPRQEERYWWGNRLFFKSSKSKYCFSNALLGKILGY